MFLKVFNKETSEVETVNVKDLDLTKHFNRNTHKIFSKEDLEGFWYKEIKKELPKK